MNFGSNYVYLHEDSEEEFISEEELQRGIQIPSSSDGYTKSQGSKNVLCSDARLSPSEARLQLTPVEDISQASKTLSTNEDTEPSTLKPSLKKKSQILADSIPLLICADDVADRQECRSENDDEQPKPKPHISQASKTLHTNEDTEPSTLKPSFKKSQILADSVPLLICAEDVADRRESRSESDDEQPKPKPKPRCMMEMSLIEGKHTLNSAESTPLVSSLKDLTEMADRSQSGFDVGYRNIRMDDKPRLQYLQELHCNDGKILRIVNSVAFRWEQLGIALGFDGASIERIKKDTFHQSKEATIKMFIEWLKENNDAFRTPTTWGTLMQCLREAELAETAQLFESALNIGAATPAVTCSKKLGILKKQDSQRSMKNAVAWMSFCDPGDFKYILKKFQPSLAENIQLLDLIPHLNHHEVLTDKENEALLNSDVPHKERVLKLLSFIEKKSSMLFLGFIKALEDERSCPGHQEMARMLKRATEESEKQREVKQSYTHPGIRTRKADTNVLSVTFDNLGSLANVHTGDVLRCKNVQCTATLSHISKIHEASGSQKKQLWICEFCGTKNEVDLVSEEIPGYGEVTYLLTPPVNCKKWTSVAAGLEERLLVFCIDTSGSMGVTTEVSRKIDLKSDGKLRSLSRDFGADIQTQYMPHHKRNVTHISRLESVKAAICEQLQTLASSNPSQRVALVTFGNEVTVVIDGKENDVVVAGSKLSNPDTLVNIGGRFETPSFIKHTKEQLMRILDNLEEDGQTALGPALLLSIMLAGQVPGSQVIVCTDGLANKGLGNLEDAKTAQDLQVAQHFYKHVREVALQKRVTVSVVTIKGEECRVIELGQVASVTGGSVIRVDPSSLAMEFSNIVANPIIATNVFCKFILHKRLYFRSLGEDVEGNEVMCVRIGNVTKSTEYSFEYSVKRCQKESDAKIAVTPYILVNGKLHLPFQLQIEYTVSGGTKLLQVVTSLKPVTECRDVAENAIDMDIMGCHILRTSARLAAEGKFTEARTDAITSTKMLQRSITSEGSSSERITGFERIAHSIQPLERTLKEKELVQKMKSNSAVSNVHKESSASLEAQYDIADLDAAFNSAADNEPGSVICQASRTSHVSDVALPIPVLFTSEDVASGQRSIVADEFSETVYQLGHSSSSIPGYRRRFKLGHSSSSIPGYRCRFKAQSAAPTGSAVNISTSSSEKEPKQLQRSSLQEAAHSLDKSDPDTPLADSSNERKSFLQKVKKALGFS